MAHAITSAALARASPVATSDRRGRLSRTTVETFAAQSMSDALEGCWAVDTNATSSINRSMREGHEGGAARGAGSAWGVEVAPEVGSAVLWYNHVRSRARRTPKGRLTPARGDLWSGLDEDHPAAIHCACRVRAGTKWILNVWPTVG